MYCYVTAHHSLDTAMIKKTTARISQPANHFIPHFTTIVMSCANIHYGLATIRRLLKSIVLFTEYSLFYRAFWRPIILRSLLIVATPYYYIAWQLIKFLTEHITITKVGSILILLRRTAIELTFENSDCPSNPSCSKSQHVRTKNCMHIMYVDYMTIQLTFEIIHCSSHPSRSKSQHACSKNCMYTVYTCILCMHVYYMTPQLTFENLLSSSHPSWSKSQYKQITTRVLEKLHEEYVCIYITWQYSWLLRICTAYQMLHGANHGTRSPPSCSHTLVSQIRIAQPRSLARQPSRDKW